MKTLRGLGVVLSLALVLFFLNLSAVVQSQSDSQQDTDSATSQSASGERSISVPEDYSNPNYQAPANTDQQAPSAAPVLGHPLDPNDVATLTGKNDQRRQPGYNGGYYYYPYSMSTDWFGNQFGTQFFPGPGGNQFFGGFGRGRRFGPSTFFFGPGPGTSFFLGGSHFGTPGLVFAPGQNWNFSGPPQSRTIGSRFGPHHRP
jgi:hypothetical protein